MTIVDPLSNPLSLPEPICAFVHTQKFSFVDRINWNRKGVRFCLGNRIRDARTRWQCWYGTMSKENFNVLDMSWTLSWTLSWTCPVQVSRPNIPLYSVIIKDSN